MAVRFGASLEDGGAGQGTRRPAASITTTHPIRVSASGIQRPIRGQGSSLCWSLSLADPRGGRLPGPGSAGDGRRVASGGPGRNGQASSPPGDAGPRGLRTAASQISGFAVGTPMAPVSRRRHSPSTQPPSAPSGLPSGDDPRTWRRRAAVPHDEPRSTWTRSGSSRRRRGAGGAHPCRRRPCSPGGSPGLERHASRLPWADPGGHGAE